MIEQKINAFFGDGESTGFGTGWWSGILSAFFGFLSFGAVLCLHFPRLLSSPELRPHYPMHTMRVLIQCLIVGAVLFGVISSILRRKRILALSGMLLAIAATALGGSSVPINETPRGGLAIGLCFSLAMSRLLEGFIYGITPFDARTFLVVACVLLAIAVTASVLPALRLVRLDPATTLRQD